MFKKMIIFAALASVSVTAMATQCPLPSDWYHKKGFSWSLSKRAAEEGWQANAWHSVDSDHTTMPQNAKVIAELRDTVTECVYLLNGVDFNELVIAYTFSRTADFASLSIPPFQGNPVSGYTCETGAANPQICSWQWKTR